MGLPPRSEDNKVVDNNTGRRCAEYGCWSPPRMTTSSSWQMVAEGGRDCLRSGVTFARFQPWTVDGWTDSADYAAGVRRDLDVLAKLRVNERKQSTDHH